jgi:hypothetical protein
MKTFKSLKKKIRRLEARLQKGEKKLARLKQKLGAAETRAAAKPKSKSPGVTRKGSAAAKSAKRKLNLTPERREQLAAAMRARWAAKRAAAGTNTQQSSGPASGDASQPQ